MQSVVTDDINSLLNKFIAYPNPTKGYATIVALDTSFAMTGIENKVISIKVFDISGRIIKETVFNNQPLSVNLSNNSSGMYFLQVKIDSETYIIKLVLQNNIR